MSSALFSSLSQRILCRLLEAEACELNPHYRDDYRIARIAVSYAASGEYKLCSPHVAASYTVLGLHPEKVWAAIVARRKAVCGAAFSLWFGQGGDRLEDVSVPKKPPRSERFEWEEWQRLKKAIGAELVIPRRLERVDITAMATSTAPAYRNSDDGKSSKKSADQWRREIEQLIDSADFSRETEAVVVKKVDGIKQKVRCKRTYHRRHLNTRLKDIWRASTSPYPMNSTKGEILCYAAVETYAEEARVSPRTLRNALRELDNYDFERKAPAPQKLGVLVLVSKANSARRPTTYALKLSRLEELARRQAPTPPTPIRRPQRASHNSDYFPPPAQAAAASPAQPSHTAAPVHVASPQRSHARINEPAPGSRAEKRVLDLRREVLARWDELKRGRTRHVEAVGGYGYDLSPDDPRYVAPMSPENAWTAALMFCSVTEREARERLKLSFGKLEDLEPSP